jgi:hypothetical protein
MLRITKRLYLVQTVVIVICLDHDPVSATDTKTKNVVS